VIEAHTSVVVVVVTMVAIIVVGTVGEVEVVVVIIVVVVVVVVVVIIVVEVVMVVVIVVVIMVEVVEVVVNVVVACNAFVFSVRLRLISVLAVRLRLASVFHLYGLSSESTSTFFKTPAFAAGLWSKAKPASPLVQTCPLLQGAVNRSTERNGKSRAEHAMF